MIDASGVKKSTLKNGIRICTQKIPGVRSVSLGIWVDVGARDESVEENGLSHFIEHMIFKGTDKRSAFEIAKEFDAIGGHTNAFTTMENTCYHGKVMDTHVDTMVEILSDIFLSSQFDEKEVERERPVIFQEIGMVEDTPEDYIHLLASASFWGDEPLGRSILGTKENVLGFTADQIESFFRSHYQPDRIVISAAGNLDHDRIVDLIGPVFEKISQCNGLSERVAPPNKIQTQAYERDLEQVHVCVASEGISITNPRRYAFSLLNTILGGNMSSRLFQEIREKKGLAYSIYSFISSHVDTGMFGIYFAVDPRTVQETLSLVMGSIEKLVKEKVSQSELRGAKEYTKGSLMLASESVDNQMVRLAQNEIHFNKFIPLSDVISKIEAVTEDEMVALAHSMFGRDSYSITLLGSVANINGL